MGRGPWAVGFPAEGPPPLLRKTRVCYSPQSTAYSPQPTAWGVLVVSGGTSTYMFTAAITPTTMTLTNATLPQPLVFTRAGAPAGAAAGAGKVLPELAGKWCDFGSASGTSGHGGTSREECFTLFPDGRYQYFYEGSFSAYSNVSPTYGVQPGVTGMGSSRSSDEGTWTATATTITAHSKKQGVTTYTLEKKNHPKTGDPMLCLDGKCFTTALQKPPWR